MERVTFLIEQTGERLGCLLNPESLVIKRQAGLRPRRSVGGPLAGGRLSDDPLLYTGGGVTELQLDLLFDTSVAGSSIRSEDIRDLTLPLRDLAENKASATGDRQQLPPVATFIWGKAWNIRGVVTAIAERLESFSASGVPGRSWLRLRFVRVDQRSAKRPRSQGSHPPLPEFYSRSVGIAESVGREIHSEDLRVHEVVGNSADSGPSERLDEIAQRHYGDASLWRVIAAASGVRDPLDVAAGQLLRIPSLSLLNRWK